MTNAELYRKLRKSWWRRVVNRLLGFTLRLAA